MKKNVALVVLICLGILYSIGSTGHALSTPNAPRIIGSSNFGSDNGTSEEAEFRFPKGMDFWALKGLVVVADSGNHQIRTIDPENGRVAALAGDASALDAMGHPIGGYVDGTLKQARFHNPSGIAIAPGGTIYIADTGNHVIRQIRDNQVSTIAGAGEGKADGYRQTASFSYPTGLALHPNGTLYVADKGNDAVRTIDPRGHVKTLPQFFNQPSDVFISRGGEIFVLESGRHRILKQEGNRWIEINEEGLEPGYRNGKAGHALFAFPSALSRVDQALYVADTYNHVVRRIENGRAETIVGSLTGSEFGGPEIAQLDTPSGLLATPDSLFISDTNNHRIIQIPKREELKPVVAPQKSQSVSIYIDGVKVEFADAKPFIRNGRTYVPTRAVLQFGGTSVNWDGKTRSVTIIQGDRNLVLSEADGGIVLKDNRSYIKLITIREAFGYSVEWDGKHNAVIVRTK